MSGRGEVEPPSVRDHLANERTLLAWIRTALTVIGLGFIVDRLALQGPATGGGLAAVIGVGLVLLGGGLAAAGAYSFLRARTELSSGTYRPAVGLYLAVVTAVVFGALAVAAFLITTRPVA